MHSLIKIVSVLVILLGIAHISFAFPLYMNADTLWFVGAGMAIIFTGLLNLVAINKGGSKFGKLVAVVVNAFNCGMFCFALLILNEPQVYIGIAVSFVATICFLITLLKSKHKTT